MLIACSSCQRQLNVPDNAAGKQVRCPAPDCGTIFTVPARAAAPPMKPAPPKPVLKPIAAQPKAPAAPFDFGGGAVAGPEADFGFTDRHDGGLKGLSMRTRLQRAAGWLNTSAITMVLLTLYVVSILIAGFVMSSGGSWPILVVAGCMPFVLLPLPIAIVVGARMLARARRWGMALTASIISLGIGVVNVLLTLALGIWTVLVWLGVGFATAQGVASQTGTFAVLMSCGLVTLTALVGFFGTFGGIFGLRVLMNGEIKKNFS